MAGAGTPYAQDDRDGGGGVRTALSGLTTRGRSFLAAGVAAAVCAYVLGQSELLRVGLLLGFRGHRGALHDLLDDLLGGAAVELGLRGRQQPVGQDGDREGLDVVRQRVVPAAQGGGRLRRAQQVQRGAR